MLLVGVLSDTHLYRAEPWLCQTVARVFAGAPVILHAGDLTEAAVLDAFAGKTVHAVCGNMCSLACRSGLPLLRVVELAGFRIGLAHGAGLGPDLERELARLFPDDLDCIVYGHTHQAVCHRRDGILFLNPGTFRAGGRGSYGLLGLGETITGEIHPLERAP
ncbi:MAG: metallophosphoesterase family protein [Thermodesulfobacteriota bacterium]